MLLGLGFRVSGFRGLILALSASFGIRMQLFRIQESCDIGIGMFNTSIRLLVLFLLIVYNVPRSPILTIEGPMLGVEIDGVQSKALLSARTVGGYR